MTDVGMHEAKSTLSQLVKRAEAGEDICITRSGKPVARLVPVAAPSRMLDSFGIWRGQVRVADDFDELPDEIADAFGMQ